MKEDERRTLKKHHSIPHFGSGTIMIAEPLMGFFGQKY